MQSVPIQIVSPNYGAKAHPTPFADFPAEVEIGLLRTDKENNYYGAAKASWVTTKGAVDLSFRSKLYGALNTFERNVFTAQIKRGQWDFTLGQLSSIQHFFSYGRGLNAVYRFSAGREVGVQAILHTVPAAFTNNTYSAWYQRRVKEMTSIFRVVANRDVKKGLHEYLFFQESIYQQGPQTLLKFNVALGWEQFLRVRVNTSG
jgi:hypothetical protein